MNSNIEKKIKKALKVPHKVDPQFPHYKSNSLAKELANFYQDKTDRFKCILPILEGNSKINLRIIDWFVTYHSKRVPVRYKLRNGTTIDVHDQYKAKLKHYGKKQFDPFKRKSDLDHISISYMKDGKKKQISTSVSQLNFLKWMIESGVLYYIVKNHDQLSRLSRARRSSNKN